MPTIALLGDSTFQSMYLDAAQNAALVTYHGFSPGQDRRLHLMLRDVLAARGYSVTATNYGLGGFDSTEAVTVDQPYFGDGSLTQWEACRASSPAAVVINYGLNDRVAGIAKATYKANVTRIVTEALSAGIVPILSSCVYVQYGPAQTASSTSVNTALAEYNAALAEIAASYDLHVADVNGLFRSTIEGGTWDIFAHNDSTYASYWENGSSPGSTAYYENVHPWIQGTELMAEAIADAVEVAYYGVEPVATYTDFGLYAAPVPPVVQVPTYSDFDLLARPDTLVTYTDFDLLAVELISQGDYHVVLDSDGDTHPTLASNDSGYARLGGG